MECEQTSEWNHVIFRKKNDGTRDHHVKWSKPDADKCHMLFSHMYNLEYIEIRHENRREITWEEKGDQKKAGGVRKEEQKVNIVKVHYIHVWKCHPSHCLFNEYTLIVKNIPITTFL